MRNRKGETENITKASEHVTATKINERVLLEILTIRKPKNGRKVNFTKKNWRILVDRFSRIKLPNLYYTKNDTIETTCE